MKQQWFKFLLGPILLIQGLWVRYKTPVLPEPVSRKVGQAGNGPVMKLLLLGDSSAAGVGALSEADSLLGQLISRLSPDYEVHYRLLAEIGKTTAETTVDLDAFPEQTFDVIITALGVNDVTSQVPPDVWRQQQSILIEKLKAKFNPGVILMSGLPPVGDFPALMWPLNAFLGQAANRLDDIIQSLIVTESKVVFHSLRNYPSEAETASDGFHPGPLVYRLWAQYLVELIEQNQPFKNSN